MAEYIDDSGSHGYDALLSGTKDGGGDGDYTYNTTTKILTLGSTASSDTGHTLPNSPFIVYEVYNVADGGNNVLGQHEYTTTIGTVATTLSTWMTAIRNIYTGNFDVKVTHYKGSDIADVYIGSETVNFPTTPNIEDGEFVGYGSEWVISTTLLADTVSTDITVHVSFNQATPPQDIDNNDISFPIGVYGNDYLKSDTGNTTERPLVDKNNNSTDMMIRFNSGWGNDSKAYISTTEIDALYRHQMVNAWYDTTVNSMYIYLPVGTYTLYVSAASGQTETAKYTFDAVVKTLIMQHPQPNKVSWVDKVIGTAGWFLFKSEIDSGSNHRIGGIDIVKTA